MCINTQLTENINAIFHVEQYSLIPGSLTLGRQESWDAIRRQMEMLTDWIIRQFPERTQEIGKKNNEMLAAFQRKVAEHSSRYTA